MIKDIYKLYADKARCIPGGFDFKPVKRNADVTRLANGYCDADEAGDDTLKEYYYSGLMIRYWYKIFDWEEKSRSARLETEDFVSWLVEALDLAFSNRRWRDPTNKLYTDKNGPDKVIQRCCTTIRSRHYYVYNLDKSKINYLCDSIDRQVEEYGDAADALQETSAPEDESAITAVINRFIKNDKILEAIIVDGICYQDTFKELKKKHVEKDAETGETIKYYDVKHEFNQHMLITHLKSLVADNQETFNLFANYYTDTYGINFDQYKEVADLIKSSNNQKLYSFIKRTLYDIKSDKEMKAMLCI